ncbi:MAG: hypothetical protein M0R80_01875 [Proteobacteria bacterium]|jgi:hypothetical protein|nr:hypothetical protein [Pseudomonadota bacterium]
MKCSIELEPDDIVDIHDMIADCLSIDLTESEIRGLMDGEWDILMDMAKYGADDTPTREKLMADIGRRLTCKPYPSHCSQEIKDAYHKEVLVKAKEWGYKVIE